jgi:dsDNA-specific endonuclease/ATPase MutS2
MALLPAVEPAAADEPAGAVGDRRVGARAVTASGWSGTIAALDADRGRATLEVGGMRLDVPLDELMPTTLSAAERSATGAETSPRAPRSPNDAPRSGRRGEFGGPSAPAARTGTLTTPPASTARRSVASSLDLRGARVEEALEMLEAYLDAAARADAGRVTVVHGHGSGAMRDAVRRVLGEHPLVREWRPGERGEGGDGATVVTL